MNEKKLTMEQKRILAVLVSAEQNVATREQFLTNEEHEKYSKNLIEIVEFIGELSRPCHRCQGKMRCVPINPEDAIDDDGMIPCPECEGSGEVFD